MSISNSCRKADLALVAVLAVASLYCVTNAQAQTDGQKTFASSKEALSAFIQAVREGNATDLQAILGAGTDALVSSGDEVADRKSRDQFIARYDAKHSFVESAPHQLTLNVGTDDWPLPIPLVHAGTQWYWDGKAGSEEIVYRRIGRNELSAIDVCKGTVSAQRDYAAAGHDGNPAGAYAQRIISEPGKQNGLYWEVKEGEPPSPGGPRLAEASSEGYDISGKRTPYHGYYYRMIQSASGFGFVAYPAEYRSSGVMTFLTNQTGVIYQKDLGEKTGEIAQAMADTKPDGTWKRVK